MTSYRQLDSIYHTLEIYGATGNKSTSTVHERLKAFDAEFLTELDEFLTAVRFKGVHGVIKMFGTALFRLSPEDYKYTSRPFLDHYIKLCETISPNEPRKWGTLCRELVSGLDNYTGHRNRTLTPETTEALLYAAAAIRESEPKTPEDEREVQQVTYYGSLPEGEMLSLIVHNPEAASRLSALFLNGTTRMAELAAAVESGSSMTLAVGAL